MKNIKNAFRRPLYAFAALALLMGVTAPVFISGLVAADGQVQERSIKLSSSQPEATGVSYEVSFKPATTITAPDIVLEFCSDTPLIGATCAYDVGATNTVPIFTSVTMTGGTATVGSVANVVTVTGAGNMTAGTTFTFTLEDVDNPATLGSFYARIYVYNRGASSGFTPAATSGTAPTTGTYRDYGGAAMSTSQVINVTARVMETLSMCVSADDLSNGNFATSTPAADCASSTPPNIEIGTGDPEVIDNNAIYYEEAYFMISTNAAHGATVRMKATNTCPQGGITTDPTGADCSSIPGINGLNAAAAPAAMVPGTAAFGIYVSDSQLHATEATTSGAITADAGYNDGTTPAVDNHFALGTDANGVTSPYGSVIAASTGALSFATAEITFAATASVTTPAGVYTGGENLIATGSF